MINRLIEWSVANRVLVIGFSVLIAGAGWWALKNTPIDAIPDVSDNQVIVYADWSGRSPQEVEDQITYPLVTNLQSLPKVKVVRASSAFGFSMVNVIFEDNTDVYWARSRILERLNTVSPLLPKGVVPVMGPDASGVGQVFWYTIESDKLSIRELRTLQDWFVRYQLAGVEGVAEVASVGGEVQQYQIDIDPERLRAFGITFSKVIDAVGKSNRNVGGNVVEQSGRWAVVRGIGLVDSAKDIEDIVLKVSDGTPVFVKNVGEVKIGGAFRIGALDKDGKEAVGGVVISRYGSNNLEVIEGIKRKLKEIEPGLPETVKIVPFYDRTELINRAISTLRFTLIEELLLVALAHIIFLAHFRSILIVSIPLPLAVLSSFLLMYFFGVESNIMSLAGIAIAIGVLVDAGIVVTENAFKFIEKNGTDTNDRSAVLSAVIESTKLVGRPVFFSMAIIILAFIPVFALEGREGKLFHPLAFTKTFAMIAATIIGVTLVPALCVYLIRGKVSPEGNNPLMRFLQGLYRPFLAAALRFRIATIALALALFVLASIAAYSIGSEFMPNLNEGDLMFMPVTDPSVSLEEAMEILKRQDQIIASFPEVEHVVGKVGKVDSSTDPAPVNMNETLIHLKPEAEWRPGMTRDGLIAEMDKKLRFPGVTNIWTQPIINRIEMLATGIRSEVGIKVFGSDLKELERISNQIGDVVGRVEGASDVYPEKIIGTPYIEIDIDRVAAARYGIDVGEINEIIEMGIGETTISETIEGRNRFPIRVRVAEEFRKDIESLGSLTVNAANGNTVPLSELAKIRTVIGPSMIQSENGLLKSTVLLNIRNRDLGSFVDEADRLIKQKISLPAGYYFSWSGQYENQQRAKERLYLVVPIVLVVIFGLLYLTYKSALEAAHIILAVPFALTGGVFLQWLIGYDFSVAVWVGYIALFGTAIQTGVVMVIYLEEAVKKRIDKTGTISLGELHAAVIEGAVQRLRPKVMTVSTVVAGLLPIMWSSSAGSEVLKPLATPVLGGMFSSLIHVLIVTPVIFYLIRSRQSDVVKEVEP
ncbi:MAG: CusA/CzcA family heavy metal efflux RND transporter [Pyrinomonadaceae bacterium]